MKLESEKDIIKFIRKSIKKSNYLIKKHARERASVRGISMYDIREALLFGDIIENYPEDKRGHSCLIEGCCKGQKIRIVCGISTEVLAIITVFKPNKK